MPWVRYWDHGFKGPTGKWYIEKSLTSLGQQDPTRRATTASCGTQATKKTASNCSQAEASTTLCRQTSSLSQIPLLLRTKAKSSCTSLVRRSSTRSKTSCQPQFPGETPVDPFDLWGGADFQLKIRNVEGYRNYDRSEFKAPSGLFDGDEVQLQATLNQLHDINTYVDPATSSLTTSCLRSCLKYWEQAAPATVKAEIAMDNVAEPAPAPVASAPEVKVSAAAATAEEAGDDGDEDAFSYFQKLANAD